MIIDYLNSYKWLFFTSFFSALTIIIIKYYQKIQNIWLLLVALFSEICLIYGYVNILKNNDILTEFALIKIIAIIMIVIPSIILFKTELTTSKIFGLIFGSLSLYLLK